MMSNNEQSSIEWLRQEWLKKDIDISIKDLFEQAKAMHRTEIIESYASGSNDRLKNTINTNYYNETFNKDLQ